MLKYSLITAFFVLINHTSQAKNSDWPPFIPFSKIADIDVHKLSTKDGWKSVQQCEDVNQLWTNGVRMIKISVQWFKPDTVDNSTNVNINPSSVMLENKPKPYLALCQEKPAIDNCPITKMRRAGKDPHSLQQFFKRLATLLQNNPNEIFILKIVNHMYQRSVKNGASNLNETQILEFFKRELQASGLDRLTITLTNRHQPLTLGEIRRARKQLIILDNHSAGRLSQYISNYNDYKLQIKQGYELIKQCLHIHHKKNKLTSNAVKSMTIDQVKQCYLKNGISPAVARADFTGSYNLQKILQDLKNKRNYF